jgi:hypothetical protein
MEKNVFVIMPFDPEFTSIFDELIKPALEEIGFSVIRADSFLDQQNILKDIIRGIAQASFIVAELTTQNANVFYELGLCHGLRVPTVLIAQSVDDIPFDLRSYRILPYSTHFSEVGKLKQMLQEVGEGFLSDSIEFGSPIIDFLPDIEQDISAADEASADEIEEKSSQNQDEGGYLDFIVEGTDAVEEMGRQLELISDETTTIGNKFQ